MATKDNPYLDLGADNPYLDLGADNPYLDSLPTFTPEMMSTHSGDPKSRAIEAERQRVEDEKASRREQVFGFQPVDGLDRTLMATKEGIEAGATSILSGGLNLATIPAALRTAKETIPRKILRELFGDKGAEVWKSIQPNLPELMGGPGAVEKVEDLLKSKGVDPAKATKAAQQFVSEAGTPSISPIVKDPKTGEEFLNLEAAKDPNFWTKLLGEEAAPMAVQAALAMGSGGAAALNPALLAKLEKAGRVGKLAIKALGSQGARGAVGFEAARILPSAQESAKAKYLKAGLSEDEAEESAATWGTVSAAAQGAVGGGMEFALIKKALEKKAVGLLPKIAGYLGSGAMEAVQEGSQSLVESAIAKMSYDPKLTLGDALRSMLVEAAGGAPVGMAVRGVFRGVRNREVEGPAIEAPIDAPIEAPSDTPVEQAQPKSEPGLTKIELDPDRRYGKIDLDVAELQRQDFESGIPEGPVEGLKTTPSRVDRMEDLTLGLTEQAESVDAMLEERAKLEQDLAAAQEMLATATRRRGPEGRATAEANVRNAEESLAAVNQRIEENTGKWQNTRETWEQIKAENRGRANMGVDPTQLARLIVAASKDGYQNASEWLTDLRTKMGEEFRSFYESIGGLEGATALWGQHAVKKSEDELGLTPQGSGTGLLSNEEIMRQQRGDTYYRVDRSGRVTDLGPQPDAPVRAGEAIVMVDGRTGQPQVQNSAGLGDDRAVLSRFGTKVMQVHQRGRGMIADNLGLQQAYEAGMTKAKSALGLAPDATDGEVVRAVVEKIGKLGASVKETTVKILNKIKGIGRDLATKIAEHLHKTVSGTPEAQKGAIGPDINQSMREGIKAKMPGEDKTQARADAYRSIENVLIQPTVDDAFAASRKVRKEYRNIPWLKNVVPARWVFSPAVISMRDDALQAANRIFSRSITAKENVVYSFAETIAKWADLQKSEPQQSKILGAALAYGTLADGLQGRKWSETEFMARFPGSNGKAFDLYSKVRDHMDKITEAIIETERERMNQLIAASEGKPNRDALVTKLKSAFEANISVMRNKAYFPLMRFGDYQITLNDAEGKRVGMAFIDNDDAESINRAIADMKAQDPKIKAIVESTAFDAEAQIEGPKILPKIQDLKINMLGEIPASTIEYLTAMKDLDPDTLSAIELALISDSDFRKRMQHRQGLPGFSLDGLRVYQAYANSAANRIARNKYGLQMDESVKAMGQKARGRLYDPALEAEALSILDSIKNPAYHPFFSRLNSISFIWDLGLRVSAGVVNLTQQGVMGLPVMSNFYGFKPSAKAFGVGNRIASRFIRLDRMVGGIETYTLEEIDALIKKYITPDRFSEYNDPKGLAALVGAVLRDAARDGELRPKAAMDILGLVENDDAGAIKGFLGKLGEGTEQIAEWTGFAMSKSEQHNRITTLIAATILAHQKGMVKMDQTGWRIEPINLESVNQDGSVNILTSDEQNQQIVDTREFAEFMNRLINFSGGRGNMAPYQRQKGAHGGVMLVAMQYKRFLIDQLSVLHNLGILNKRTLQDKAFAKRAYAYLKPALKSYAVTGLVGGTAALPLWMVVKSLMKMFFPDDYVKFTGEVRDWLTDLFGASMEKMGFKRDDAYAKKLAFAVENGMANALPDGMAFNLNPAMTPQLIMAPEGATRTAELGTLVAGSTAGKVLSALDEMEERGGPLSPEALGAAAERLAPRAAGVGRAFRGLYRTGKGIAEGNLPQTPTFTRRVGKEDVQLSPGEAVLDLLAFTPTRIARWQQAQTSSFERYRAKKQLESKLKTMAEEGRTSDVVSAAAEWRKNWPKNPEMWVDPARIISSPRTKARYTEKARVAAGVEREP